MSNSTNYQKEYHKKNNQCVSCKNKISIVNEPFELGKRVLAWTVNCHKYGKTNIKNGCKPCDGFKLQIDDEDLKKHDDVSWTKRDMLSWTGC